MKNKCPRCHSIEFAVNTWEAWCGDCGFYLTQDMDPLTFKKLRETYEDHIQQIAKKERT